MSQTATQTETYSVADIETVMRRVKMDLMMIASSTGAATEERAKEWAHDIELLAKGGYLKSVDITILSNGKELKAACFTIDAESGTLSNERPGDSLWPRCPEGNLRIVLSYTHHYDSVAKDKLTPKFKRPWSPSSADISHTSLASKPGREYSSNGYGVQRKDFGQ
ncbi:TPA: hypothetical protein NOZ67_004881 [Pseudomonas aeruginosa]|nr:hypothetical protein [Pseudomonas aeruginosa]MBG4433423.1 hypothetical protein [Pseudomonas aeruginosa]MBG4475595.1 hypothetical protein [Pseudomonas aeruginosa]MBX6685907.1 hypothetical protein [Pseudomonas aeruginosa]HCE5852845.1 hypothetical protein [Pseudomonas aeruginosa]